MLMADFRQKSEDTSEKNGLVCRARVAAMGQGVWS